MPRTDPACRARQAATRCCLLILLLNLQGQTKTLNTNTQYTNTNKQIQKMTISDPPVAKQVPSGCFTSLLLIKVQYTPHLANQIFSICHLLKFQECQRMCKYGFHHRLLWSRADGESGDFAKTNGDNF